MTGLITVGILAALLVSAVLYGFSAYNRLVSEGLKVDNQWSQIDIVLKQRAETIPNLVCIVERYASHEKELLTGVTQARSRYEAAGDREQAIAAARHLGRAMDRLFAVAENYPELKVNDNFVQLQQQYFGLENKIADFRQFYNDTVMRYNRLILTFPSSLIASAFHFRERSFFRVEEEDRKTVEIRF